MAVHQSFTALFLVMSYGATFAYNRGCDFSQLDLDGAVDKVIGLLPRYRMPDEKGFRTAFKGFETGTLNITGLETIQRYGPIQSYCVNGTRLISVDLIEQGDAMLTLPWRACSGQEGTINLRTKLSRFTLILRVEAARPSQEVRLAYEGPIIPVFILDPKIYIEGAGTGVRVATMSISKIFPALSQRMWFDYFLIYFRGVVRHALRDAFP
ncbi:hypothetical protein MRX96_013447 [Rhipicephalus microplus]|uniref:Uncharacterized protein n=1 Tax=Rhipicephalus microplus TaxID=6941 RepID=A0A9J6D1Z8_RHIMP|nr:uncharacterized protein LOC119183244 [Rhipicephalus microplus]KAH7985528.1 hypothetical protein HPB51_026807 [Rhipicephalus microplus]